MRIGTDLEYLVLNSSGTAVPAGLLGLTGRKGHPEPLKHGGVEVDCCAVETTPKPATNPKEFAKNILGVLAEVQKRYPQYKFATKPSHVFPVAELEAAPYAMEMGCQPDYNAWTKAENPRPSGPEGLRSFGGHVHVEGGTELTVKAMDLVLGTWSVINDPDQDRRKLYGKAGSFRFKPYGIEYRVLSNFWCDNRALIEEVFTLTRLAQRMSEDQLNKMVATYGGPDAIQSIINTSNVEMATIIHEAVIEMLTNEEVRHAA